jgi:hypothetical protein
MKASELRIGNYFIEKDEIKQFDGDFIHLLDMQPIPITKELLLKLGFLQKQIIMYGEAVKINYFIKNNLLYSLSDNQVELDNPNVFLTDLKYVHQLQNIYFALTSEELTFK